jgi:protein LTV1
MGRKKPFIEKGEGVKFYLVHRSQKDPLYLDENLGEHVLVPADPETNRNLVESINGLTLSNKNKKSESEKEALKRKRLEEQQKFGVYYEDDYNYLQHLREVDGEDKAEMDKYEAIKIGPVLIKTNEDREETSSAASTSGGTSSRKLQLPSSVFASNFEEDVGYFNQAAPDHDPKINWDPDIVKFLDEDENLNFDDADNEMEDDFFIKANSDQISSKNNKNSVKEDDENGEEDDEDEDTETEEGDSENESDDSGKRYDSFSESQSVKDFETKSKFTSYSMSSSVIKRNDGLRLAFLSI